MAQDDAPRDRLGTVLTVGAVVTWGESAFGVVRAIKRREPTRYGSPYVRKNLHPVAHWTIYVDRVEARYVSDDERAKPADERRYTYAFQPATFMVTAYCTVVVGMTKLDLCRRFAGLPLPAPYAHDPEETTNG